MRVLSLIVTLGLVYSVFAPAPAYANGRFPKAQAIAIAPGSDGSTIALRATFGVIVSNDGGHSWSWLCEQALGFTSTWDPPIATSRDGRLWVALTDGARVASNGGCTVDSVPALKGELVADVAVDGSGDHVFAVSSTPSKPAYVWRSDVKGAFTRLGKGVSGFQFDTIEVASSDPKRVYLTATPDGQGSKDAGKAARAHIFRSNDGGATIAELHAQFPNDGRLFVSAIDPSDPDRVLVRQLAATGSDVLLSTDGGTTFKSVLHFAGAMFGFARTTDGSAYYAGSGDPKEGIWRSLDRGATWEQGAHTSVFCLNAEGPKLLVCSNPYTPGGYAMGESTDRGMTVTPVATFDAVQGPVACDGGSACDATWNETRTLIATRAHWPIAATSARAGAGDASIALDAGPRASPPPPASDCDCSTVGARPGETRAISALLLAIAVSGAAFRARSGSRRPQNLK